MFKFRKRPTTAPAASRGDSQWLNQVEQQVHGASEEELVVDLANVERIDSRELGVLVKIHFKLRQHDRRLVLRNAHGGVLEVLELTRMDRLLEVRSMAVAGS